MTQPTGRPRKPDGQKRRSKNISLSPEIIERLEIEAPRRGMSESGFVEWCLREEFKREAQTEAEKQQLVFDRHRAEVLRHLASSEAGERLVAIKTEQAVLESRLEDSAKRLSQRAHILAAAGSPITAEVEDWEAGDGKVLVRLSGLSMAPKLNDGDVIEMRHKSTARSPFMKKGLIYLIEYDGGFTVKRYNTRKATKDEIGEEWVVDGKVKILESINPNYPDIVIKGQLEWVAWLDEKEEKGLRAKSAQVDG